MSVFSKNYRQAISEKVAAESFVDKPLGFVQGIALSVGRSLNNNIYSVAECKNVTKKLLGRPMYYEHVNAEASIGRVTETDFDGYNVHYKAAIFDTESWNRIQNGVITKVSIGFNYEYAEPVNGQLMHNLDNLELSLVALGGVPNASIAPVKNEHLLEPFTIGEHLEVEQYRGVESMKDVRMQDILDAVNKKKNAKAVAESVAALETALRGKIEAENAAATPTEPETPRQIIADEVAKQLTALVAETKKQMAEQNKEGAEQ